MLKIKTETDGSGFTEITVPASIAEDWNGAEACVINVTNDDGTISRFWIKVKIKKGRPVVSVTTKTGQHLQKQTQKTVTGSFNIEPRKSDWPLK